MRETMNSPQSPKRVLLFTDSYPYTTYQESFIGEELRYASRLGGLQIRVVPLKRREAVSKPLPAHVAVDNRLVELAGSGRWKLLLSVVFGRAFRGYAAESLRGVLSGKGFSMMGLRRLVAAELVAQYLAETLDEQEEGLVLYSYWFSFAALGIALAARRVPAVRGALRIARAHGYELLGSEAAFPLRAYTLQHLDRVYCVSEEGCRVLQGRYPRYADRFAVARLGVAPAARGVARASGGPVQFVSCSSLIALKRVELIAQFVCHYATLHSEGSFEWHHFGEGPTREVVASVLDDAQPPNLQVVLHGNTPNEGVLSFYAGLGCAIFVNLSTTEGVPVAIMEALANGMPVLATDVGGNRETLTLGAGVLLAATPHEEEFTRGVERILQEYTDYSEKALQTYEQHFNSDKNYGLFYQSMVSDGHE